MVCKSILWLFLLLFIEICEGVMRNWNYELISISVYSEDESQLRISARLDRTAQNDMTFTVEIDWMYDTDENDMGELLIYRSSDGTESQFKQMPHAIPKSNFEKNLEKYYKNFFYSALSDCSNLVKFEDFPTDKFPQGRYRFNNCELNYNTLPQLMPEGTYKLTFKFWHYFEWGMEVVARVTPTVVP